MRRYDDSPVKAHLKQHLDTLVFGIGKSCFNPASGLKDLWQVMKALHQCDAQPNQRYFIFHHNMIVAAIGRTSELLQANGQFKFSEANEAFQSSIRGIVDSISANGATIEDDHLINPLCSPIYKSIREDCITALSAWLPAATKKTIRLDVLLDDAIIESAQDVLSLDSEHSYFQDDIRRCLKICEQRMHAFEHHNRHIDWLWRTKPIFSINPEPKVSLSKVYVGQRCFWNENHGKIKTYDERDNQIARIGLLDNVLKNWLTRDVDPIDRLRIIMGGPGSGKSSFAQQLAFDVKGEGRYRVIMVRLQHVNDLHNDPITTISTYLNLPTNPDNEEGCATFDDDPLDWCLRGSKKCLIILDGLDELAGRDEDDKALLDQFTTKFHQKFQQSNYQNYRAIILGRDRAIERARDSAGPGKHAYIHTLPIAPITERDLFLTRHFVLGADENVSAKTENGFSSHAYQLAKRDQRPDFLKAYRQHHPVDYEDAAEAVTSEDMGELTHEPLLLHLLIQSGYTAVEEWSEVKGNRARVYHKIFMDIWTRQQREKPETVNNISEDQFFEALEALGLASWHDGTGRTAKPDAYKAMHEALREDHDEDIAFEKLELIAVQFYTRPDTNKEKGYELIHKTFGEYLTARALVNFAFRYSFGRSDRFASEWLQFTETSMISDTILGFIREEVMRIAEDGLDAEDTAFDLMARKNNLTKVLKWVLEKGFPANDRKIFREMETRQRCAEHAFLAVLTSCSHALFKLGERDKALKPGAEDKARIAYVWPDRLAASRMIARLFDGQAALPKCLAGMSFSKEIGTDDNGNPIFEAQDLSSADLRGADLRRADLTRADLLWASLMWADLTRADLKEADLREADAKSANWSLVHIDSIRLQFADLRYGDNLNQSQIKTARGNVFTQLPDGLEHPDHWDKTKDREEAERIAYDLQD